MWVELSVQETVMLIVEMGKTKVLPLLELFP